MAMRMEMGLQQRLELKMKLAPQIIQSIEILQLPTLELQQRIKQELVENPVLEEIELKTDSLESEPAEEAAAEPTSVEELADYEQRQWQDYADTRPAASYGERDKKHEAMQNTAARQMSLQDFLFNQFSLLDITPEQRLIGENIIYNIDDSGYLQSNLYEIAAASGTPSHEEVENVLKMVQTLEPPGVAARDVKECLLLQLSEPEEHPLVKELIEHHLEDIHMNRFPKIMKETHASAEEIQASLEYIKTHLNARPGGIFSEEPPQYITPDIIVEPNEDSEYEVRLEDDHLPQLYISPLYQQMLSDTNTPENTKEFIRRKLQAARWLIESIEQRRNTLKKITSEIVKVQKSFFEQGIIGLRPLKMRTIATATGVHVSTVSRAISEKYMQTPRGIFPLKFFFSGGMQNTEQGNMTSRKSVKQRLLDLIELEDKTNPFSDDEIADKLQAEGLDIARRTITKYRKAMRIPSSRRRKSYVS